MGSSGRSSPDGFEILTRDVADDDDGGDLLDLDADYRSWLRSRRSTIEKLRAIADHVDSVRRRSAVAKAVGSGSGAVAGGLTMIGGIMTIASAGALAIPVLLVGTGLGIASGLGGGAAAVAEKVISSRQMKEARKAVEADRVATFRLECRLSVAKDVLVSAGGAAYNVCHLVTGAGTSGLKAGIEATAQLLGEDVGKEVSKAMLRTSGRVLSGTVTVVFGGVAMIYDIYRLTGELEALTEKAAAARGGACDIRKIADELEGGLREIEGGGEVDAGKPVETDAFPEEKPVPIAAAADAAVA